MNYYISDPHFGHANIIKLCRRPFASIDEMDHILIDNWNARVHQDDNLSDSYINRCELASDTQQVSELGYHMAVEYAERLRRLRLGDNSSILVLGVTNYVRRHTYEPIRTEDVAQALFVSRGSFRRTSSARRA